MHSYSLPLWYRTLPSRAVGAAGATAVGAAAGAVVVGAITVGSASGSAFQPLGFMEHPLIIPRPTSHTGPHPRQSTSSQRFTNRRHPRLCTSSLSWHRRPQSIGLAVTEWCSISVTAAAVGSTHKRTLPEEASGVR